MAPHSVAIFAAALAVLQAGCWALARALGMRLERRAVALGLLLPVTLLAPWLFGGDLLAPTGAMREVVPGMPEPDAAHRTHLILNDTLYQFIPWELEVRHALRAGRLPLWADNLDGGGSPWLNPQAGALSPIAMLARPLPIQRFFAVTLCFKLLLALEGTWLLARRLGRGRVAALVAAVSFALGGGVLAWGLFPHTATVAWVPWLALGCVETCRRPRPAAIAATALVTAALLLSGHPETALAGGLFAAAVGVGLLRRRCAERGKRALRGVTAAGLAAALGCGLAAPQVVPFLRAVPGSQRARDMTAMRMPPYLPPRLAPSTWFLPVNEAFLQAPTNPRVFGVPYGNDFHGPYDWPNALSGYAGLAAFAGALVALLAARPRAARPFLAFAALAFLVAAGFLPIAEVIHAVPALRLAAYQRLLPVAALALGVAAAFGWDFLLGAGRGTVAGAGGARRRLAAALAVLAGAAAVSLAAAPALEVAAVWALLAAAALTMLAARTLRTVRPVHAARRHRWGAALLVAALALDLVPWALRTLPRGQGGLFFPPNPLTARLAAETRGGPWRAVGLDKLLYPGLLSVYGVADVRANNVLAPADYLGVLRDAFLFAPTTEEYYSAFRFPDHPMLSFLNVRVVAGDIYLPRPHSLTALDIPDLLPFLIFRNDAALPRWFLPTAAEPIERAALDSWVTHMSDPRRVAVFRDEAGGWLPPPAAEAAPARLLGGSPGHLRLALPGQGERLLATSLTLPAGWVARDGARRLRTLRVNGAFLGVRVPPGTASLQLDFTPPGLHAGVAIGAVALAGWAALALLGAGRLMPRERRRNQGR